MTLNTQFNKSCALAYFSTSWIQWNDTQWAHVWFLFSWGQCMWTMHWNRLKAAFENIKNNVVFCRLKTVPFCSVPLKTHSVQSPDNHHRYNSDFCSLGHDMPKFNTCHDKEIYKRMMVFELNLDSSINDWTNKQKKPLISSPSSFHPTPVSPKGGWAGTAKYFLHSVLKVWF